jgi:CheY-like chemotaxis protein
MTLRILLIEDDKDDVRVILDAIRARDIDATVTVATSRDSAEAQLEAFAFEFVVCDLKIPTVDGGLDAEIQHGLAAFSVAQEKLFGAPVMFLSAFGTVEILEDILAKGRQDDPYGRREPEQMLHSVQKSRLTRAIDIVERASIEASTLNGIVCRHDGTLDWAEERVIQIFARMYQGVEVQVREFRGGLSNTKTLLVRVTDGLGAFKARGVMKIGSLDRVEDESDRYAANVPAVLGEGVFVPQADVIRAGADGRGAVVFTFADDHVDLYGQLNDDEF